jgi:methionyl-tRNA formyltransferase
MRIVFMGSAPLSCACLRALCAARPGCVVAVVCQPDRPRGRSLRVGPCPVKELACGAGIEVLTPSAVNAPESVDALRRLRPDLAVVVAYGQILRRAILDLPPLGCLNIHASLLPKYRGAAPIQWAVARGETVTGVTAMYMNERMDAGDILLQRSVPVGPEDTAGDVHEALAPAAAEALVASVALLESGKAPRRPQDERLATRAPKLSREDGRIDWTLSARDIHNRVRGFNPWPGCHTVTPGARGGPPLEIKVLRSRPEQTGCAAVPGTVLDTGGEGPLVAAGTGALRLREVQPAGRKAMGGAEFARGYRLPAGVVLGRTEGTT